MGLAILGQLSATNLHASPFRCIPLEATLALHFDPLLASEIDFDFPFDLSELDRGFDVALMAAVFPAQVIIPLILTIINQIAINVSNDNSTEVSNEVIDIHDVMVVAACSNFVRFNTVKALQSISEVDHRLSDAKFCRKDALIILDVFRPETLSKGNEFELNTVFFLTLQQR